MTVDNKDIIKNYLQIIMKILITFKMRVYDFYKRNKKKTLAGTLFIGLLICFLAPILTHQINRYIDENRRDNFLASVSNRNPQYSSHSISADS